MPKAPKQKPTNPKPKITPSGQTPIEEAIGDRTKPKPEFQEEPIPQPLEQAQIPDEPSPSEMLTLEELNRQTEERLQEPDGIRFPQEPVATMVTPKSQIPVSKRDLQPATKTSFQESPPQVTLDSVKDANQRQNKINEESLPPQEKGEGLWDWVCPDCNERVTGPICQCKKGPQFKVGGTPVLTEKAEYISPPAEDIELTALRKYILEDGFVLATVSFHIVTLCAEPMTTPSTTTWDYKDRANIPDMVLALLNQPGYLEGIWPSLKIVMGSNAGNAAWTAGISTTIAFFDVIRTLPALKELQNGS